MNRSLMTTQNTFGFIFGFWFNFTGDDSKVDLLC